jgi:hypothetical protein
MKSTLRRTLNMFVVPILGLGGLVAGFYLATGRSPSIEILAFSTASYAVGRLSARHLLRRKKPKLPQG